MADNQSVRKDGLVTRDSVTEGVRHLLYVAVHVDKRFTVIDLARKARLSVRKIRSYMSNDPGEIREPSLSAAMSIAAVLGEDAVNEILSLIAFGGARYLGEAACEDKPMQTVACLLAGVNEFAQRAADGEYCDDDRDALRRHADAMIAKLIPLSSTGGGA